MAAKKKRSRSPGKKAPDKRPARPDERSSSSRAASPGSALPGARPPQPTGASSPAGLAGIAGIGVGLLLTIHGASVAFGSGLDRVSYWLAVVLVGPLLVVTSSLMMRGQRSGWAFFVGITGPAALATFFGAPTIRKALAQTMGDSGLALQWTLALGPMLVFSTLCVLASVDHARFEDAD